MENQIILAVDDSGKFLEFISKAIGHKGEGRRHLAITVLLVNKQGQFLLQKRKHRIFDGIWDFTGATHPLHKLHPCHPERLAKDLSRMRVSNELRDSSPDFHRGQNDRKCRICGQNDVDETLEEATQRCLEVEWGIKEGISLKNLGFFNYFAKDGNYCENEHCAMMVGEYDGEVNLAPEVGYEYKWMGKEEFLKDLQLNPQAYAPWVIEGAKFLKTQ